MTNMEICSTTHTIFSKAASSTAFSVRRASFSAFKFSMVSWRDCTVMSFEGDNPGEVFFLSKSASLDYANNIRYGIIHNITQMSPATTITHRHCIRAEKFIIWPIPACQKFTINNSLATFRPNGFHQTYNS